MIKPPFTILILKDSQSPVAIRITKGFYGFFLIAAAIILFLSVNGVISIFTNIPGQLSIHEDRLTSESPNYTITDQKPGEGANDSGQPSHDIRDIAFRSSSDGNVEITFMFENMGNDNEVFVWVILNPDGIKDEVIIYPRSPIFRGFPVDFRNGILQETFGGKPFRASFSGSEANLALGKLRILVYTLDGKIIIDKTVVSRTGERKQ